MRTTRLALTVASAAAILVSTTVAGAVAPVRYSPPASQDVASGADVLDTSSAIVVLAAPPLATYDGKIKGYEKTRPDRGKLNPNSAAAKKYLGYLKNQHDSYELWLRKNVPSAKITSQYFTVMNAVAVSLQGAGIGRLARNPNVISVEYNARYTPAMSQSLGIIHAAAAWAGGASDTDAGAGIKVGILDTGIDYRHPFLRPNAGMTYPAGFPKCDENDMAGGVCKNVSAKVIVARVFTNKENQLGATAFPVEGEDHGTHVAGTVAGKVMDAPEVDGVQIDGKVSGVAPGAWLGNYNVLYDGSGRSEDILNGVEAAVLDGMDVLNLSLGGGYRGNNDILAQGLDNAVAAGVVVVASAGNNGPGAYTIGSPGRARDIITAGASTNHHFVGQSITAGGRTIGAALGDFAELSSGVTYSVRDTNSQACNGGTSTSATNRSLSSGELAGKLGIVNRGGCVFSEKVQNAKRAGAIAVVVVTNVAGDPSAMGRTEDYDDGIPAVMVAADERGAGKLTAATTLTAGGKQEFITDREDILAGFSSMGPTFVDEAIKPDLTSVGVNVLSSTPCAHDGTAVCTSPGWAFYSGTSMSAPHLAGSAAVLLENHPTWSPADVKSALTNTADDVIKNAKNALTTVGPMAQGAGRENLGDANTSKVTFVPVSASYGKISATRVQTTPFTFTLTNRSGSAITLSTSVTRFDPTTGTVGSYGGGSVRAGDARLIVPGSVVVPANGSATFTIAVRGGLPLGSIVQGWITFTGGGATYRVAYWANVAP